MRFIGDGIDDRPRVRYTRARSTQSYAAVMPYLPPLVQLFDYFISSFPRVQSLRKKPHLPPLWGTDAVFEKSPMEPDIRPREQR